MLFGLLVMILSALLTIACFVFMALLLRAATKRAWNGDMTAEHVKDDTFRDTQDIYNHLTRRAEKPSQADAQPYPASETRAKPGYRATRAVRRS